MGKRENMILTFTVIHANGANVKFKQTTGHKKTLERAVHSKEKYKPAETVSEKFNGRSTRERL
jgi:hypothetical protein